MLSGEIPILVPLYFCKNSGFCFFGASLNLHYVVISTCKAELMREHPTGYAFTPTTRAHTVIKLLKSSEGVNSTFMCDAYRCTCRRLSNLVVVWSVKTFVRNTKLSLFCESCWSIKLNVILVLILPVLLAFIYFLYHLCIPHVGSHWIIREAWLILHFFVEIVLIYSHQNSCQVSPSPFKIHLNSLNNTWINIGSLVTMRPHNTSTPKHFFLKNSVVCNCYT